MYAIIASGLKRNDLHVSARGCVYMHGNINVKAFLKNQCVYKIYVLVVR